MARKINSIGVGIFVILCILLIFASHRITFSTSDYKSHNYLSPVNQYDRYYNGKYSKIVHHSQYSSQRRRTEFDTAVTTNNVFFNATARIEDVINAQRQRISEEMKDFEFVDKSMMTSQLTLETDGRPFQSGE